MYLIDEADDGDVRFRYAMMLDLFAQEYLLRNDLNDVPRSTSLVSSYRDLAGDLICIAAR